MSALSDTLRTAWYDHAALRWGSPSPHFVMKSCALARLVVGSAPGRVLDIGCDTGLHGMLTAIQLPTVRELDGFDLNQAAIARATAMSRSLRRSVTCRFWVDDMDRVSLGREYDLILWIDSVQYAREPTRMLREVVEHLSAGGVLVTYCPVADGIQVDVPHAVRAHLPDWSAVTHVRRSDEMASLLASSGLHVRRVQWVGKRPYRTFRTYEYWLRSHSLLLGYAVAPLGWILARKDHLARGRGSGVFYVAEKDS